jgi:hypothetical protein
VRAHTHAQPNANANGASSSSSSLSAADRNAFMREVLTLIHVRLIFFFSLALYQFIDMPSHTFYGSSFFFACVLRGRRLVSGPR